MRHYQRPSLPIGPNGYLDRKSKELRALGPSEQRCRVAGAWAMARKTKTMREVFAVLCRMVGPRKRCMYCEDSRGTDIEHFWPKSQYPARAFEWANMLMACSGCQNSKGSKFPVDDGGSPLLVDPTMDHPWDFLFFVPHTGRITPRYDPQTGQEMRKGRQTVDLLPLNDEAVAEGRARVSSNLVRVLRSFLDTWTSGSPSEQAVEDLLKAIRDNSEYGLADWYFRREGQADSPFAEIKSQWPYAFQRIEQMLCDHEG